METTNYLILGSAVVFGMTALHLISLSVRYRNLQHDLALLEKADPPPPKKKKTAKKKTRK